MHQGFQSSLIPGVSVGRRFLATRLRLHGTSRRRPLTLFLVSAYAPDSGKPQAEHEEYAEGRRSSAMLCSLRSLTSLWLGPTPTVVSACVASMTMPMLQIVIAGLLVYRTITFVGANSTQSLGYASSHFRRRFSVKLPEAGAWVVGSIVTHRRLGTIHALRIYNRSTISLSSRMI